MIINIETSLNKNYKSIKLNITLHLAQWTLFWNSVFDFPLLSQRLWFLTFLNLLNQELSFLILADSNCIFKHISKFSPSVSSWHGNLLNLNVKLLKNIKFKFLFSSQVFSKFHSTVFINSFSTYEVIWFKYHWFKNVLLSNISRSVEEYFVAFCNSILKFKP